MLSSSVLGGILQLWSKSVENRQQEHLLTLEMLTKKAEIVQQARTYSNKGFQWTRRIIALTAVFFVIAFPKIVAVYHPSVAVHIGYPELSKGFWFFSSDAMKIKWVTMRGLTITPLDTHLLAAIIGMYFGGSLTKTRS